MKEQKLKKQIMKQTVTYILVLFIVISIITSGVLYHSRRDDYLRQNRRFLSVMHQQVDHFLMHPEEELRIIEQTILNVDSITEPNDEINYILQRFNYIERVEYLNAEGVVLNSFPKDESINGMDYSRNPIYTEAKYNTMYPINYGSTFIDPISENISMPITLKTKNGNYLVGYLNLKALRESFSAIDFKSATYAILDENGNYVLYPKENFVKERRVNENFNEIRMGAITNGEMISHQGIPSIIQYQRIQSTEWTLILYQDINDMLMPIYMTLIIFIVALIIILITTFSSLNYNLEKVDQVLLDFIDITQKVSQGDYETTVPNYPYSEFQHLSNNFKNMIEEVEIREEEILKLNDQLEENYLNTVFLLARTIEAKDTYTGNHCDRVKYYAMMIGKAIGLDKDDLKQLSSGSLLHDIGKLGVSENILTKPGRLTEEEYSIIQGHSQFGYELIKDLPEIKKVKDIVLYHHEHFDGGGYPEGLKGNEIPLLARIVCIADAYDAMTSKRVYKSTPMTTEEAIKELKDCKNKQFDGKLVDAFIKALRS